MCSQYLLTVTWNVNTTITKTFSTVFKSNWIPENCKFIIVVYKLTTPGTLVQAEVQQSLKGNIIGSIGILNQNEIVNEYSLYQNYPNPFNPTTNIKFSIPESTPVNITLYDVLGKEITVLCNQYLKKGVYNIEFDASALASGTYFYTLRTNNYTSTKKMLLVK